MVPLRTAFLDLIDKFGYFLSHLTRWHQTGRNYIERHRSRSEY